VRPGFVERGRSVDARIDGLVRGRPHAPAVYFQSEAPRRHFATTSISTPGMPCAPAFVPLVLMAEDPIVNTAPPYGGLYSPCG